MAISNTERRTEGQSGNGKTAFRILVCDPIAEDGVEALKRSGADVDVRTGLSPEELRKSVDGYDALVVRSETKVTREIIEASSTLQVVGRAGIGVDNIDLDAATEKGVVVVNAPTGNVISAAEHAIALMLSLSRHIPDSNAPLRSGKWERGRFQGTEVRGKTLGIVGLGQVGSEVARRAKGLEMRVLAHDPFVPEERARVLGVDVVPMEKLVKESDYITVHTTLTEGTKRLIGEKEPLTSHPLFESDKVVVTPHLGASTAEAQERVAVDVAEQIMAVLRGEPARYAVNAPLIPAETYSYLAPYVPVAFKAGELAVQLHEGQMGRIEIDYSGEIAQHDVTPLKAAVVGGLLAPISEDHVNVVNVDIIAQRRGLQITETRGPSHEIYANLVKVRIGSKAGGAEIAGTLAHDGPHIVSIDGFWVDVPPSEGYLLLVENKDRPGMVGAVGTLMGEYGVNISFMNVGRHEKRGTALMVLALDETLTPEQIARVKEIPDILGVKLARL